MNYKSAFGKYEASAQFRPGFISYYRKMEREDGKFPSSAYSELAAFFNKIYKADRVKIVLVRE
jgi:hypothetical protein